MTGEERDREVWTQVLPVTRLNLVLEPETPWRPGPELGNTVRGAFGAALRSEACVAPDQRCQGCGVRAGCPYGAWFEGAGNMVRPFALRASWQKGELVSASRPIRLAFVFFGPVPRPDLLTESLVRMARVGLGPRRVPHRLVHALAEGLGARVSLLSGDPASVWPDPAPLSRFISVPPRGGDLRVLLVSPVDFGKALRGRMPSPADLLLLSKGRILSIARLLGQHIGTRWPRVEQAGGRWDELRFERGRRKSAAQGRTMPVSGWTGSLLYPGETVRPFVELLAAAEVVQVGGWTTAGLGAVSLQWGVSAAVEGRERVGSAGANL